MMDVFQRLTAKVKSSSDPALVAYAYPPAALLHKMIILIALVLGHSAALNGDPNPITSVNSTSQAVS